MQTQISLMYICFIYCTYKILLKIILRNKYRGGLLFALKFVQKHYKPMRIYFAWILVSSLILIFMFS